MQKKLIALAVAGLASSGAFAQMNVTVYGQLDLSVSQEYGTTSQNLINAAGAATTTLGGVGNASINGVLDTAGSKTVMRGGAAKSAYKQSYVGFKGTEDLGSGMKLDFDVRTEVFADGDGVGGATSGAGGGQSAPSADTVNGGPLFGNIESSVAVTTGIGRFKFGRMTSVLTGQVSFADPFLGKGPGSTGNMIPLTNGGLERLNNDIRYDAQFGDFGVGYEFGMSENQDKVSNVSGGSQSSLFASYVAGPWVIRGGRTIQRDFANPNELALYGTLVGAAFTAAQAQTAYNNAILGRKQITNLLGGTYDFSVVKLHTLWARSKTESDTGSGTVTFAGVTTGRNQSGQAIADYRFYMLGATVPMGPHAFKISYVNLDDKRIYDRDATSVGLGYEYSLSKRTTFYSRWAKVNGKNGAAYGANTGGGSAEGLSTLTTNVLAVTGSNTMTSGSASASRTTAATVGLVHSF